MCSYTGYPLRRAAASLHFPRCTTLKEAVTVGDLQFHAVSCRDVSVLGRLGDTLEQRFITDGHRILLEFLQGRANSSTHLHSPRIYNRTTVTVGDLQFHAVSCRDVSVLGRFGSDPGTIGGD
jgi:hypothetical protein